MQYYKSAEGEILVYGDNFDNELLTNDINTLGLTKMSDTDVKEMKENQDKINLVNEKKEIETLKLYLNETNYVAINYGAMRTDSQKTTFLETVSDTYNITNEKICDKRDAAIARINELELLIAQ